MENENIRIGITPGDTNAIGYELILKAFSNPALSELCVPIVYGAPKVANFYRKTLKVDTPFTLINSATEAEGGRLNLISCTNNEAKVEPGVPTEESGRDAMLSLQQAIADYRNHLIDVLVTCPIDKKNIFSDEFNFIGHTDYLEHEVGDGEEALMILMNGVMKVALVTTHLPLKDIPNAITQDKIERKIQIFNDCLKRDFTISIPRIAVLSLNPHNGDGGLLGTEEDSTVKPAINAMREQGIQCFGPYSADGFFGAGQYHHFDGVLAMYHDQGLAPFKALSMEDGVNFTAGLPIIRTSPDHGTAFDIAGKGEADENSFRQAIYTAIDIWRNRLHQQEAEINPLKIISPERDSKAYTQRTTQNDIQ